MNATASRSIIRSDSRSISMSVGNWTKAWSASLVAPLPPLGPRHVGLVAALEVERVAMRAVDQRGHLADAAAPAGEVVAQLVVLHRAEGGSIERTRANGA